MVSNTEKPGGSRGSRAGFSRVEGGESFLPRPPVPSPGKARPWAVRPAGGLLAHSPLFKSHTDPMDFAEPGREGLLFHPPPPIPCNLGLPHRSRCVWTRRGPRKRGAPRAQRGSLSLAVRGVLRRPRECPARRVPPPEASGGSPNKSGEGGPRPGHHQYFQ